MPMTPNNKATIDWIVRPSTLADADAINELFAISWTIPSMVACYGQKMMEQVLPILEQVRFKSLLDCGTYYVVLHPSSNRIVGAGGWTFEHPMDTGTDFPHIRHVASHPDFARQGIASALWHQCWKDILSQTGQRLSKAPTDSTRDTLTVEVLSTKPSQSFYEKLGFVVRKEMGVPIDEGSTFDCFYMTRQVSLPWIN